MRDDGTQDVREEAAGELAPAWPRAVAARRRSYWVWLLPLLAVGAVAALWLARGLWTVSALSVVLAYLVSPVVELAHRRWHVRRGLAILGSYVLLALVVGGAAALVLPDLARELQRLGQSLPAWQAAAEGAVNHLRAGYRNLPLPAPLRSAADAAVQAGDRGVQSAVAQALRGVQRLAGLVFALLLAPVLTYYLLVDLDRIRAGFARLLPQQARAPVGRLLHDLDAVLAGWIRGELMVAAAVAGLATVALLLLGVHFAFLLGIIAGMAELIPYFGPYMGAVPAIAMASAGGLRLVLLTAAAFLVIQELEGTLLAPRVVGGAVGLHPLVVIGALLLGEHLFGIPGLLLAVPSAAILRVLVRHAFAALTESRSPRSLT